MTIDRCAVPRTARPSRSPSSPQEFDITPRAIRFYEDMGLLAPARAGRNRVYTQRDRTRLKLTLRGKRLGLSLPECSWSTCTSRGRHGAAARASCRHCGHRQQLDDIRTTLAEIAA